MENCLGGQVTTGSCGQSCRGVTGGGCGHGDRGAGQGAAVSFHSGLCYLVTCATWAQKQSEHELKKHIEVARGHEEPNNYYTFIGVWWCMDGLGDYRSRKSHGSWGPGVFNFNTLTFILNLGRYVLVSKNSNCLAIVHRESLWWQNFHFHSENFT